MRALDEIRDELAWRAARIAVLESQVARLTAEVAVLTHTPIARLAKALSMTSGDASFLHALYRANGALVTHDQLDELTPGHKAMRDVGGIMKVRASRVRRALGREAIVNHHGKGYSLSSAGMASCSAALGRAEEHA